MRLRPGLGSSKLTVPRVYLPSVDSHVMRRSGSCSMIFASHSACLPDTVAAQCNSVSSSWRTSWTPSMNRGKFLELRPLVVRRRDRNRDLDLFLERGLFRDGGRVAGR